MRLVKHCHNLPREVVDTPSLETLKVRSDDQPDLQMALLTAGVVGLNDL